MFIANRIRIEAQMHGGGHEGGMRSGTATTTRSIGTGEAYSIAKRRDGNRRCVCAMLRNRLAGRRKRYEEVYLNGDLEQGAPNIYYSQRRKRFNPC